MSSIFINVTVTPWAIKQPQQTWPFGELMSRALCKWSVTQKSESESLLAFEASTPYIVKSASSTLQYLLRNDDNPTLYSFNQSLSIHRYCFAEAIKRVYNKRHLWVTG